MDPSLVERCEPATWLSDTLTLKERGKAWTKALSCCASPRFGEETRCAWWRGAKRRPKICLTVRARDLARRSAELRGERQRVDPSLVLQCEPATQRGDMLSLVERVKTWTQALSCGTSPRLGKEKRRALRREENRGPKPFSAV